MSVCVCGGGVGCFACETQSALTAEGKRAGEGGKRARDGERRRTEESCRLRAVSVLCC